MLPYQQRVIEEQSELQIKLQGLTAYLSAGKAAHVSDSDWQDLLLQEEAMDTYNTILLRRVSNFKTNGAN